MVLSQSVRNTVCRQTVKGWATVNEWVMESLRLKVKRWALLSSLHEHLRGATARAQLSLLSDAAERPSVRGSLQAQGVFRKFKAPWKDPFNLLKDPKVITPADACQPIRTRSPNSKTHFYSLTLSEQFFLILKTQFGVLIRGFVCVCVCVCVCVWAYIFSSDTSAGSSLDLHFSQQSAAKQKRHESIVCREHVRVVCRGRRWATSAAWFQLLNMNF